MEVEDLSIDHGGKALPAQLTLPSPSAGYIMILTHGAGGDHNHQQLQAIAQHLATHGSGVLLFTCKGLNIVYRTRAFVSVIAYVKSRFPSVKGLFIGGRSMGSRAAVAAVLPPHPADDKVMGIICLSYPLHTPNKSSIRDQPLFDTQHPCLFVSGSEDEMAQRAMFDDTLAKMKAKLSVKYIEGGNHALKVKGKTPEEVTQLICGVVQQWYFDITRKHTQNKTVRPGGKRKTLDVGAKTKRKK